MFFVRLPAVCTRCTLLATTPSLWAKCFPLRSFRVSRCCSFAASTRAFLSDRERSPVFSLLTTHYSLLTTHYSLLTTHYSLLTTHYSLLTTRYSLLATRTLSFPRRVCTRGLQS